MSRTISRFLCAALFVPGVWAADSPLVADTFLSSANNSSNFGAATALAASPTSTTLLQFDTSAFSGLVTKATLTVFVDRITSAGSLAVAPVTSTWNEGTVTNGTAPSIGATFANPTASASNQYLSIDVTSVVQGWVNNPSSNFGLAITVANGQTTSVFFDSKENTVTSHPARLDITIGSAYAYFYSESTMTLVGGDTIVFPLQGPVAGFSITANGVVIVQISGTYEIQFYAGSVSNSPAFVINKNSGSPLTGSQYDAIGSAVNGRLLLQLNAGDTFVVEDAGGTTTITPHLLNSVSASLMIRQII